MSEDLRVLLYPLGFLATLLFGLRFYFQWLSSERKKVSYVPLIFWHISLTANVLMAAHDFIQLQFPMFVLQVGNAIISWRNIELRQGKTRDLKKILYILTLTLSAACAMYCVQALFIDDFAWMRTPQTPWGVKKATDPGVLWGALGVGGITFFATRFWIQWFQAERAKASKITPLFWKISLIGGILSFAYFFRILDIVNMLSYGLGCFPYIRNLMLSKTPIPPLNNDLYFVVAGEKSGDLLGEELVSALKEKRPECHFEGVGGPLLQSAGVKIIYPLEKLAVMGFADVVLALPRLLSALRHIERTILARAPASVVLIDYQDFNLLLAKRLRKKGYSGKIIQYVSPSVWAWRKKRIYQMEKTHDLMLSIFPFEKEHYATTSLQVVYVGHPLVKATQGFLADEKENRLTLFPGSRLHEIERNLPLQLQVAQKWLAAHPDYVLAISCASPKLEKAISLHLQKMPLKATLVPFENRYALMQSTTLALATSGTVNLELALCNVPTVVTYKLNYLNYLLGRYVFAILLPNYCIVNILSGKTLFPEFIDKKLVPEPIHAALERLHQERQACQQALAQLRLNLGDQEAAQEAAEALRHQEVLGELAPLKDPYYKSANQGLEIPRK